MPRQTLPGIVGEQQALCEYVTSSSKASLCLAVLAPLPKLHYLLTVPGPGYSATAYYRSMQCSTLSSV